MGTNQLSLGIVVALRDAFSAKARSVEHRMRSLEDTAYRSTRGIRRAIGNVELGFMDAARAIAAGAAVLGTVVFPIVEAAKFSAALSEIAGIADRASFSLGKVRDALLDQSLMFPSTPLQQAEAAYQAVSSGFLNTAEAVTVTAEATKFGVTTLTETSVALRGLTGLVNAYSDALNNARRQGTFDEFIGQAGAKLFQAVRFGRLRGEDVGKYIGYVASAASVGGLTMDDMLATWTGMTLGSLSPEQSAQYFRQLVIGTIKPTRQAENVAREYKGLELGKAAIDRRGGSWSRWLFDTYDLMFEQNKGDESKTLRDFARLLSGRQAFAGAATLLKQRFRIDPKMAGEEAFANAMAKDQVMGDDGILRTMAGDALRIRMKELDYQWSRLTSATHAFFMVLGDGTKKAVTPFVRALANIVGYSMEIIRTVPLVTTVIQGLVAAAGIAMVTFGFLQIKWILGSSAVKELVGHINIFQHRLLGINLTSKNLIPSLAGFFTVITLGTLLVKKAFQENLFGMQDKLRDFKLMLMGVGEAFANERSGFGYITSSTWDQMNEALKRRTVTMYLLLFRTREAARGVADGFRAFYVWLLQATFKGLDFVEKVLGPLAGPGVQAIREFFTGLSRTQMSSWRQLGFSVGKILSSLLAVFAVTKLWNGGIMVAVGGWKLLAGAIRLALIPANLLKRAVVDWVPNAIASAVRYWSVRKAQLMAEFAWQKKVIAQRVAGDITYSAGLTSLRNRHTGRMVGDAALASGGFFLAPGLANGLGNKPGRVTMAGRIGGAWSASASSTMTAAALFAQPGWTKKSKAIASMVRRVTGLSLLGKVLRSVGGSMGFFGAALAGAFPKMARLLRFVRVMPAFLGPWGIAITAIVGLLPLVIRHWDGISSAFGRFINLLREKLPFFDGFVKLLGKAKDFAQGLLAGMGIGTHWASQFTGKRGEILGTIGTKWSEIGATENTSVQRALLNNLMTYTQGFIDKYAAYSNDQGFIDAGGMGLLDAITAHQEAARLRLEKLDGADATFDDSVADILAGLPDNVEEGAKKGVSDGLKEASRRFYTAKQLGFTDVGDSPFGDVRSMRRASRGNRFRDRAEVPGVMTLREAIEGLKESVQQMKREGGREFVAELAGRELVRFSERAKREAIERSPVPVR